MGFEPYCYYLGVSTNYNGLHSRLHFGQLRFRFDCSSLISFTHSSGVFLLNGLIVNQSEFSLVNLCPHSHLYLAETETVFFANVILIISNCR